MRQSPLLVVATLLTLVAPRSLEGQPLPPVSAVHPDEAVLARGGYACGSADLVLLLGSLTPGAEQRAAIARAIGALGRPTYAEREAATAELARIGAAALDDVDALAAAPDLEVRTRAATLARGYVTEIASRRVYFAAAARVLGRRRALPAFAVLLHAARRVQAMDVRLSAEEALEAIVGEAHRDALAALAASPVPADRILGARLLGRVAGDTGVLVGLAAEPDPEVRLAAAEGLTRQGEFAGLRTLVALLDQPQLELRSRTHALLADAAGVDLGFKPTQSPALREAAIDRWVAWLDGPGKDWRLAAPLPERRAKAGIIVYCAHSPGRVVEVDAAGNEIQVIVGLREPMGFVCMADGRKWVLDSGRPPDVSRLLLYDADGILAKRLPTELPANARDLAVLPDGRLAALAGQEGLVTEVDPATGNVISTFVVGKSASGLTVLSTDRFLVALFQPGEVIEMDRAGKRYWSTRAVRGALSAYRLASGNTLIAAGGEGRVVEVDPAGTVCLTTARTGGYDAHRLPSGNTLVASQRGVTEVDSNGTEVNVHVPNQWVVRVTMR